MKKIVLMFSLMLLASMTACSETALNEKASDNKTVEKTFAVSNFDKIALTCYCNIHYVQGKKTSLKVKGSKTSIDLLEVSVEDGVLVVKQKTRKKKRFFYSSTRALEKIEAYITSPTLSKVSISGAGNFTSTEPIKTENLSFRISGSGNIRLNNATCSAFETKISGSGNVNLQNLKASKAAFRISGSGNVNAKMSGVSTTEINVSGSGDIHLTGYQCGSVSGKVSGSGDINLNGDFKPVNVNTSGSGKVRINNG